MDALRRARRLWATWLVLGLAALLLLGGCGPSEPEAPKVDEAALRRAAEEAQQRAEEAKRLAEQQRIEREKRELEALQDAFGTPGQPPAVPAMVAFGDSPVKGLPEGIPYDEAVPPLPKEPQVRVAVFGPPTHPEKARNVALIIGTYERERLEESLGMAVKIAYVAAANRRFQHTSEIHYRPDFLRAAQSMAIVLPADQHIGPMSETERGQEGIDVVVYVSEAYR